MSLKLSDCSGFLSDKRKRKAVVLIGAALILLIFVSTLLPSGKEEAEVYREDAAVIEQEIERRLELLISRIGGVSSPVVMVTLDSTSETVYARDSKSASSTSHNDAGSSADGDDESTVVLIGSGSDRSALEESRILPKVRGVAVVCGGADDPIIREKVVNTIAGVLDIGTSRIYVTD